MGAARHPPCDTYFLIVFSIKKGLCGIGNRNAQEHMTNKIASFFVKPKHQDKDSEKEFYNRPARNIARVDKEALYQVRHQHNILIQASLFASKLMEKESLSSVRILEVGSNGDFYRTLRNMHPETDISLTVGDIAIMQLMDIEVPSAKANLDLEYLPFKDRTFDFILVNGVLHHLPDIDACSKELMRVCKNCIIATNDPCGNNPLVLLSRIIGRFLSHFVEIDVTVNETPHSMSLCKYHFCKYGAKSVIINNGDEIFSNDQNWISYLSCLKRNHKSFLRFLQLSKSYLQRTMIRCFSKYPFSWNSYIIFITY